MGGPPPGGGPRLLLRPAAACAARLWTPDEIVVGNTIDVSEHGICLATAPTAALRVGRAYRLELGARWAGPPAPPARGGGGEPPGWSGWGRWASPSSPWGRFAM